MRDRKIRSVQKYYSRVTAGVPIVHAVLAAHRVAYKQGGFAVNVDSA